MNGKAYSNECGARCAGVFNFRTGPCIIVGRSLLLGKRAKATAQVRTCLQMNLAAMVNTIRWGYIGPLDWCQQLDANSSQTRHASPNFSRSKGPCVGSREIVILALDCCTCTSVLAVHDSTCRHASVHQIRFHALFLSTPNNILMPQLLSNSNVDACAFATVVRDQIADVWSSQL